MDAPGPDFLQSLDAHRAELRLHCYRMLGSSHDAQDMVQETFLRAWRGRAALRDAAHLRSWLYRIATRVCLDELERRPRRRVLGGLGRSASDPELPLAPPDDEDAWIEPVPDTWLDELDSRNPLVRLARKENVALAFLAALQELTPMQRAVFLLRDVVELSAKETAAALDVALERANSALFRARKAIERARTTWEWSADSASPDPSVLASYLRAWEAGDLDAFIALLHREVKSAMPPSPTWIDGLAAHRAFYAPMFRAHAPGRLRLSATRLNGCPALAFYRPDPDGGPFRLRAVQRVEWREDRVLRIDHFMLPRVFPALGLPLVWP